MLNSIEPPQLYQWIVGLTTTPYLLDKYFLSDNNSLNAQTCAVDIFFLLNTRKNIQWIHNFLLIITGQKVCNAPNPELNNYCQKRVAN